MTVVVADTSPLNYLILVGEIGILSQLYERIVIPEEVFAELIDADAPQAVRAWAARYPGWVEIRKAPGPMPALMGLDAAELAAIALAEWEADVLLLIDDAAGRRKASRRGIPNTGTLGVLRRASLEGLVDRRSVLNRLLATNFRDSTSLVADLLAEDADRKR